MNSIILYKGVCVHVSIEHGHLLLEAEGKKPRCDFGEVGLAVPEFELSEKFGGTGYSERKIKMLI
ncbi:hypothetical protein [Lacrimispora sp.]|uniref:hypothetical protein n=1 Tax=Lacrimispora sp. TaxID=2719234 RepID=UPI0004513E54|nr:hypothetical protein [Lacrimispora sp.]EXG86535.1 hypothetical protein K413DRAFT_3372 [Clostridium sp. ASBs410]MDR7813899.1 hypothetical protein [Lacrimispora sp.]